MTDDQPVKPQAIELGGGVLIFIEQHYQAGTELQYSLIIHIEKSSDLRQLCGRRRESAIAGDAYDLRAKAQCKEEFGGAGGQGYDPAAVPGNGLRCICARRSGREEQGGA